MNEILENAPQEMLKTAYENPIDDKAELKETNKINRQVSNVEEKMKAVINDPATKESLTEDILKSLPKNGFPEAVQRNFLENKEQQKSLM